MSQKFKRYRCFLIVIMCVVFSLMYYVMGPDLNDFNDMYRGRIYTILYWTPMFGNKEFNLGIGSKIFRKCEYANCFATFFKELKPVTEFDAILFHDYDMSEDIKPINRSVDQVYVYSNQESPKHSQMMPSTNFYNWTMTYRLDSDIFRPYGRVRKKKVNYRMPSFEKIHNRSGKIAWMASNCFTHSRRESLAKEIRKYMPVDIIGYCGDMSCPKSSQKQCYAMLEKKYNFYLSFENSLCKDYVTEKLYNILQKDVVPIVYGGADYQKFAPPNSVIDVDDFKSVSELIDYVKMLEDNPLLYQDYLKWKSSYVVETDSHQVLCDLCEKLNKPKKYQVYADIREWYAADECEVSTFGAI